MTIPLGIILSATFLVMAIAMLHVAHRLVQRRQRRERRAAEAERDRVFARNKAQIKALKTLRYCVNEQNCDCCKNAPRGNCPLCLVACKCDVRVQHPCHEKDCPGVANMDCAICLENFVDGETLRLLPCRHVFHVACADKWLAKGAPGESDRRCPMCKHVAFRVGGEPAPTDRRESAHRQLWRERVADVAPEAALVAAHEVADEAADEAAD